MEDKSNLLPERTGQADVMTVAGIGSLMEPDPDAGHWYSPAAVRVILQAASASERDCRSEGTPSQDAGIPFRRGDLVRKRSGSQWKGRIVGEYSTTLTPEGYAVESEAHAGSVQIYPAAALELILLPNVEANRPKTAQEKA